MVSNIEYILLLKCNYDYGMASQVIALTLFGL
jgi:hypothetical protein